MKHLKYFVKTIAVAILISLGNPTTVFAVNYLVTTGTNFPVPLDPHTNDTLSVTATGSITTTASNSVFIEVAHAGTSSVTNFGTIASTTVGYQVIVPTASNSWGAPTITINNSGFINPPAGTNAIDFSTVTTGGGAGANDFTINQNAGSINGGIVFPNAPNLGSVLNLNGGTITGSITGGTAAANTSTFTTNTNFTSNFLINNVSTIAVNGGTFLMNVAPTNFQNFSANAGGTLTFGTNLTMPAGGTLIQAGTLNQNGFTITGVPGSGFFIDADFASNGPINNVPTIAVNFGTFLMNSTPTNFTTFDVTGMPGTLTLATNFTFPVNGTLLNAGTINQNGFAITGAVGSTFTSTTNFSSNGSISAVQTINANGGTFAVNNPISGYTLFQVGAGGTANLNSGGSLSNSINLLAGGTLNLNSGTLAGNITGNGNVNVNSPVGFSGTINANNVNVNTSFTPPGTINATNVIVTPNGVLTLNNNFITAAVTNNGTIIQPIIATNTIAGNYIHNNNGTLQVAIGQAGNSLLQVNGTATFNGGTIQVNLSEQNTNIANNQTFDILNTTGGLTINDIPTVTLEPPSPLLSFTPEANGNDLLLVAHRNSLEAVNTIPTLQGVAAELDAIQVSSAESNFTSIFNTLGEQTSVADIEAFLEELLPEEALGGIVETGIEGLDLPLEEIIGPGGRTHQLRAGYDRFRTGYNAGDMAPGRGSYGPFFFGSSAKQGMRDGINGYTATNLGFGFLADAPVSEYIRLGVAASYAGNKVRRSGPTRNLTIINSGQGMLYGSVSYGPLFVDATISIGHNTYRGTRNIRQLGVTASSTYQGNQYGGKVKAGFIIPVSSVEISPLGSVDYLTLNLGGYTEKGAGNANLIVNSRQATNTQIGVGVRITETSQPEDFLPEIHALYLHDVKQANLIVTSQFVQGGGSFITYGPLPAKSGINVGASISALVLDDLIVAAAYDYEAKKSFTSHSASIKFRKLF